MTIARLQRSLAPGPPGRRAIQLAAPLLVFLSSTAAADTGRDFVVALVKRLQFAGLTMVVVSFVFGALCVHLGARFMGVASSPAKAAGAVLLGGVIGLLLCCPTSCVAFVLPPSTQGVVLTAAAAAGGALGVKLVLQTSFQLAALLYFCASAAGLVAMMLVLVVVF